MSQKDKGTFLYSIFCIVYISLIYYSINYGLPSMTWEILNENQIKLLSIFFKEYFYIAVLICVVYLVLILTIRNMMKNKQPFSLRNELALWSFFLGMFSVFGSLKTLPFLVEMLQKHGVYGVVCDNLINEWFIGKSASIWLVLFNLSKIPELIDTFFIVLRKKELIPLHVYHHITVLLYCFQSMTCSISNISNGLIYSSMNFTVHAFMYTYYGLTALGYRPQVFARYITMIQIIQMFIGTSITIFVNYKLHFVSYDSCSVDVSNSFYALILYASFLWLFAQFFVNTYMKSNKSKEQ